MHSNTTQLTDFTNYLSRSTQNIYRKTDAVLQYFLGGYFAFGLFLAIFYDTWLIATGVGGLCLIACFFTRWLLPDRTLYQYVTSTVLAVFMAQFIYQMHGLFEMHFFAFLGAILLISYQNWRVHIPLFLAVVIHHALFAFLQYQGNEVYFTQMEYMSLQTFLFHAGLAGVIIFACGLLSYRLHQRTVELVENNMQLGQQLKNSQKSIEFAEAISSGNLNVLYECQEGDELGESLIRMRDSLRSASQKEEEERFVNVGLAEISTILRSSGSNADLLAVELVKKLVKYLGVNQGGLFIVKGEAEKDPHLELAGCYAYDRVKHQKKRVEVGEGLLGQSLLEKDLIYLTDIPEDFVTITSGLGGARPKAILIVPLKSNEQVVGVIEIAAFQEIPRYKISFLEKVGESIAATLISASINQKTTVLLEEFQSMNEQMRAQEEEMRQNLEELQATQEELERKVSDYEVRLQEKDALIQQLQHSQPVKA